MESPEFLASKPTSDASPVTTTESEIELKLAFAQAAEQRGDLKQALSTYQDMVATNQASAEVHHRMALICDRTGDSLQAEEHYLESLKLNATEAKVLCDYAYNLYLRESWEASEAHFLKAIEADPQ